MSDSVQGSLIIRIPAILRANGLDIRCFVEMQHEQCATDQTYTRCRVLDDPPHLADGEYMVEFAEQSLRANRYQGKWGVLCLTPVQISEAA